MNIVIISASVRIARKSHRVALYLKNYITANSLGSVEIADLNEYKFPVFDERLKHMRNPTPDVLQFAGKIKNAAGVIIVTPEYNGGYPASLKNVIDLLYAEWKKKPIAIVTVSDGSFGGTQVITSLLFTLWKIGAWVVPARYPVPKVHQEYAENGDAKDVIATDTKTKIFLDELLWCMEAGKRMKE